MRALILFAALGACSLTPPIQWTCTRIDTGEKITFTDRDKVPLDSGELRIRDRRGVFHVLPNDALFGCQGVYGR